jgi:lipid-A-disaccharide synthase
VLLAPSLPLATRTWAIDLAARTGVETIGVDARRGLAPLLPAFDVALVAAGTATLECALAGATPVIVARADRLAALLLRRMIRTPHLGLPNVVLGRRAYAELWQDDATPDALAREAGRALATRNDHAAELRRALSPDDGSTFGARVAEMLA